MDGDYSIWCRRLSNSLQLAFCPVRKKKPTDGQLSTGTFKNAYEKFPCASLLSDVGNHSQFCGYPSTKIHTTVPVRKICYFFCKKQESHLSSKSVFRVGTFQCENRCEQKNRDSDNCHLCPVRMNMHREHIIRSGHTISRISTSWICNALKIRKPWSRRVCIVMSRRMRDIIPFKSLTPSGTWTSERGLQ